MMRSAALKHACRAFLLHFVSQGGPSSALIRLQQTTKECSKLKTAPLKVLTEEFQPEIFSVRVLLTDMSKPRPTCVMGN
jgi:hypothetical protein